MKLLGYTGKGQTRVLVSLLRLHETYGRATCRAIAADIDRSHTTVYEHLKRLRAEGLVTWEGDGKDGTLRPTVRRVA